MTSTEGKRPTPLPAPLPDTDFDFDRVYYLAGPMSGYENYNYPKFETDTSVLRSMGIKIESPHENKWPEDKDSMTETELWSFMMDAGTEQMSRCDGIILLKGWPQSTGACLELDVAIAEGSPVYFYDEYVLTSMNKKGIV